MKKPPGPQHIGTINVQDVCPYSGWRGEYRDGSVDVFCNFKGDNEIGLVVNQSSEQNDDDEQGDDIKGSRCADIVMTIEQALDLAETLVKSIKHANSH